MPPERHSWFGIFPLVLALLAGPLSAQTTISQCSTTTPGPFFGDTDADPNSVDAFTDTITVSDSLTIEDAQVLTQITHTFIGDIVMMLTAPDTTVVILHQEAGEGGMNLDITWDDQGVPYESMPFDCACAMQPAFGTLGDFDGGTSLGDWVLDVSDTFPTSGGGTLDNWCIDLLGTPTAAIPVDGLTCQANSTTGGISATWSNPVTYDAIEVLVQGSLETTLSGTATSYDTQPIPGPFPVNAEVCIRGIVAQEASPLSCCSVQLLGPAEIEECQSPALFFGSVTPVQDTITVGTDLIIEDTQVVMDLTHGFLGDVIADLMSPAGTTVRLHDLGGLGDDDLLVVYSDAGIDNAPPYNCGCAMQPSGPGALADFNGSSSAGEWTLQLEDIFPTSGDGTLNSWCVRIPEGCPLPPPTSLTCAADGNAVDLSWTNGDAYDGIDIERDGTIIDSLPGAATSYTDTTVAPGVHDYRVYGNSVALGCGNPSPACTVPFGVVEICNADTLIPIPDATPTGLTDIITVAESGPLTDLDVSIAIIHSWIGDLQIDLTSPTATTVTLKNAGGGDLDNILTTFDDQAMPFDFFRLPNSVSMAPENPGALDSFTGDDGQGLWTLTVIDHVDGDIGTLNDWCVIATGVFDADTDPRFIRGDCDGDGVLNGVLDGLQALFFGFVPGTAPPPCLDACDFENNGIFNGLVDGIGILTFQFVPGSPPPAPPYPECGEDSGATVSCDVLPVACSP